MQVSQVRESKRETVLTTVATSKHALHMINSKHKTLGTGDGEGGGVAACGGVAVPYQVHHFSRTKFSKLPSVLEATSKKLLAMLVREHQPGGADGVSAHGGSTTAFLLLGPRNSGKRVVIRSVCEQLGLRLREVNAAWDVETFTSFEQDLPSLLLCGDSSSCNTTARSDLSSRLLDRRYAMARRGMMNMAVHIRRFGKHVARQHQNGGGNDLAQTELLHQRLGATLKHCLRESPLRAVFVSIESGDADGVAETQWTDAFDSVITLNLPAEAERGFALARSR